MPNAKPPANRWSVSQWSAAMPAIALMLPLSLVLAMPLTAEEPQKPSAETADTSNATMTKVSEIEGISEYRLDNGTRVL
ncbi:MAG: hypothetical protein AAFN70_21660, partial [Planctomycetota bacterium]